MFIGRNPLAIESLVAEMGPMAHSNPSVVAAYDMALFDILGKVAGLPVFRLLGGDKTTFETDVTTGIDTPEAMASKAKKHAAAATRPSRPRSAWTPTRISARIQAIREAIGPDIKLRIDANQGWTRPQAIYALKRMEKFKVQLVEQPVVAWDIAGLKSVRDGEPHPDHGRRSPLPSGRRRQAHPGRRLRLLQHQADEGRRHPELGPDRPHRRRRQHALHGRLHARIQARPDRGRPRRRVPEEHRLCRPRRERRHTWSIRSSAG